MSNDTDGKVKVYKNPERKSGADYKPYVPQYQVEGVEPKYHGGAVVPSDVKLARTNALPLDNPRAKRSAVRQPYAEVTTSPIGRGRGPVPNVGNNMEHTWSSVDGEIVDDFVDNVDQNHEMVDNNDFVSDEALGFQNGITAGDIPSTSNFIPQNVKFEEPQLQNNHQLDSETNDKDLFAIVDDLEEDTFLLIVGGTPLCSGPKEEIEEQARALVFGDHELCEENPVPIDDIIILKRVKVKVGLFLE